jgi:hypothetical protein
MINQIEWTRKQVEELRKMLKAAEAGAADLAAVDDFEKRVRIVEDRLLAPTLAEADVKSFRGPLQLYLKLVWLQAEVSTGGGDVSGNADFGPTQAELDDYRLLSGQLAGIRHDFEELYEKNVPAFNEAMRSKGYVSVMTVAEPEEQRPEKKPEDDEDDDWDASRD